MGNECAVSSSYLVVFTDSNTDACKYYRGNEACDGYYVFYFPVVLHFSLLVRVYGHLRYTGAREIRDCEDYALNVKPVYEGPSTTLPPKVIVMPFELNVTSFIGSLPLVK